MSDTIAADPPAAGRLQKRAVFAASDGMSLT